MSHACLFSPMKVNKVHIYHVHSMSFILVNAVRELKIENWVLFCMPDNSSCLQASEYQQSLAGNLGIDAFEVFLTENTKLYILCTEEPERDCQVFSI